MFSRLNFVLYNKTHKPTEISVGLFLCTYSGTYKKFSDTYKKVSDAYKKFSDTYKKFSDTYKKVAEQLRFATFSFKL